VFSIKLSEQGKRTVFFCCCFFSWENRAEVSCSYFVPSRDKREIYLLEFCSQKLLNKIFILISKYRSSNNPSLEF